MALLVERTRRALAVKLALMLVIAVGGLNVLLASPASAGCTGHTYTTSAGPYYDWIQGTGTLGLAMRTGPHTTCTLIMRIPEGYGVQVYCWVAGGPLINYQRTWSYARIGNTYGWLHDGYLAGLGSPYECPEPQPHT